MFHDFLGSDRLIVRFISLYAMGLAVFFAAWTVSYWILPEGLMSGFGPLNALAGDSAADTLLAEFLTIFGLNLLGLLVVVVANYVLRVRNIDNMKNLLRLHYRGLEAVTSYHIQRTGGGYGKHSACWDGRRQGKDRDRRGQGL